MDEVYVKINGELRYLWRAVDHEGEVLETVVTAKRDKAAALKFLKRIMKRYGRPRSVVTDGLLLPRGHEGDRQRRSPGDRSPAQQSGGELASAVSTTRAGDAAVSKDEDPAEIQLSSRPGPQPFQSGTSSRHPRSLQTETLGRAGRVAVSHGLIRTVDSSIAPNGCQAQSAPILSDKAVVRYPLSLCNVEGLPAERGIDISHETVRFWWNRFWPRCSPPRSERNGSRTCAAIRTDVFICMRCSCRSTASPVICGAQSTMRARSCRLWSLHDGTRLSHDILE